tara:strand:- start:484 stop:1020 length:537 start_codon:yes stop_codon:yes gene_type:complete
MDTLYLTYEEIDASLNGYIKSVEDDNDDIFVLNSSSEFNEFIENTDNYGDINYDSLIEDLSKNNYVHDDNICSSSDCNLDYYKANTYILKGYDASINTVLSDYEKNISRLEDSLNDRQYVLFVVWVLIFILIFTSFCFTVIESKTEMNLILRLIIYIFIFYVLYKILYGSYSFINEYI